MTLDVELYRRTIYLPTGRDTSRENPVWGTGNPGVGLRRISVLDIHPERASRTLVFVHGYGGNALQWLYQLRFFGQTMRVVAPELRGHGHSDDPSSLAYTMAGLVDDLETVLATLDVPRPFYLIAHSFGGAVAAEYVLRHPQDVNGLVLIAVPRRFVIRPELRRLMNIPDVLFNFLVKKLPFALYAQLHTLRHMYDRVMAIWRGDERMQQLRVPTLVVLGHRDRVFLPEDYEDVARAIPNAHQVVIPVSAHLVQLERPDAVNRAIRRFIETQVGAGFTPALHPVWGLADQPGELVNRGRVSSDTLGSRFIEMPWLQHYDDNVPEQVPLPEQLLHEMLSNAAIAFPHRPALIFFGQKIRYRELDRLTNRFAHALQSWGIKKGDRVAIVLPNIPQFVIAFYGTLKAGAVVVIGSPLSNEQEISYQLQNSGSQVLLTLASYRAIALRTCANTDIKQVIYTDVREYLPIGQRVLIASLIEGVGTLPGGQAGEPGGLSHIGLAPALGGEAPLKPSFHEYSFQHLLRSQSSEPLHHVGGLVNGGVTSHDLALLLYTSGTTDTPKGVMLSHANSMVNVTQTRHWIAEARRGREVILCVLPLSHSYGLNSCMNVSMALAASLVLLPTTRTDQILETIKKERPTIFPGVPALYLAIANYPKVRSYGVSTIRWCISGSSPLPVEVQEAFEKLTRGRLVEGYGLTEASPVTHSNPLKGERRVGSIGIPLPSTHARIVDLKTVGAGLAPALPPGQVGELIVRGPQVMQGYWNMPEETAKVLKDGWLHTGDLARMDEDGFFTIVDRKKDLILAGTYNVYPRDIEEVLYEHPKVLEAAVVSSYPSQATKGTTAESNAPVSPFIKAVVVLKRGEKATPDELLALCRERLDAYKVPRQIEFRTELPKNLVGKVLRRLLIEA